MLCTLSVDYRELSRAVLIQLVNRPLVEHNFHSCGFYRENRPIGSSARKCTGVQQRFGGEVDRSLVDDKDDE